MDVPHDPVAPEHEIKPLQPANENGSSPSQVSPGFGQSARVEIGSKIGSKIGAYLAVLTASNVRGMLRRKEQPAADPASESASDPWPDERAPRRHLQRWEDDGGT
jgi:hypothetical protein